MHRINSHFIFAFVIIFLHNIFSYPSLSYRAEIWAEAGNNYFTTAFYEGIWANITKLDFSYIPLFPRLLAFVIVKILGIVKYYNFASQFCAIFFVSFFCSLWNLNYFRLTYGNKNVIFLFSILFGLLPNYEIRTYTNFIYFSIPIIILFLVRVTQTLVTTKDIFISFLIGIFLCSKGTMILFLPIISFLILYSILKKNLKLLFVLMILFTFNFTELLVMLNYKANHPELNHIKSYLSNFKILLYSMEYIYLNLKKILFFDIGILFILFPIFFIHKLKLSNLFKFLFSPVLLLYLSIGSIILVELSMPNANILRNRETFVIFNRMNFMLFSSVILLIIRFLPLNLKKYQLYILIIYFFANCLLYSLGKDKEFESEKSLSHSDWNQYHKLLNDTHYYIPINPYPWHISYRTSRTDGLVSSETILGFVCEKTFLTIDWSNKCVNSSEVKFNLISNPDSNYLYYLISKPESELSKISWNSCLKSKLNYDIDSICNTIAILP